jgi:drug/metabolite transporter (DMT)-like permease
MKINKTRLSEWLLALAIIVALILVLNPFGIIMTSPYTLTVLMILGVAVIAFGAFIWRERYRDEREELHAMKAGRLSYFTGGAILVIAIMCETLAHTLDPWLVIALAAMVATKLAVSAWHQYR